MFITFIEKVRWNTIKHQRDKIVKLRNPNDIYSTPTKECSGLTTETGTLK